MTHLPIHGPRGPMCLLLLALQGGIACAADSGAPQSATEVTARMTHVARITIDGPDATALDRAVSAVAALRAGRTATAPVQLEAADAQAAAAAVDRLWAAGLGEDVFVRALPAPQGEAAAALKRRYLACEEDAMRRALDSGSAARCSQVYEALLRGVFRGRFEDLHAWWRGAAAMP
jgi:hypothetical protein